MNVFIGLVGSNPLPVFVTLSYLFSEERTDKESLPVPDLDKVFLVCSDTTKDFKDNIINLFNEKTGLELSLKNKNCFVLEDERDLIKTINNIGKDLSDLSKASIDSIHLNYSGGTKTMGVASFEAVSKFYENCRNVDCITAFFSDLDPTIFKLKIGKKDGEIFSSINPDEDVRRFVKLSIEELYRLHGLELEQDVKKQVSDLYRKIFNKDDEVVVF